MTLGNTKICNHCKIEFPKTTEYFYMNPNGSLRYICKKCNYIKKREYEMKRPELYNKYHREYNKRYYKTERGKEIIKKSVKKYQQSEKGKATVKRRKKEIREAEE